MEELFKKLIKSLLDSHFLRIEEMVSGKLRSIESPKVDIQNDWHSIKYVSSLLGIEQSKIRHWYNNDVISFRKVEGAVFVNKKEIYNLLNKKEFVPTLTIN